MNTNSVASSLANAIDRHSAGQPVGKRESHDLNSLCRRLLAPRDVVEKLLASGVLRAEAPVHANDSTGLHSFRSDDLNTVRAAVLTAIVERTIDESDGDPEGMTLAATEALRTHAASFNKKRTPREFCRFPTGLVQLSRYGEEEQPGFAERAVGTLGKAAAIAGAGALAYGGASYFRGRAPGLSPLAAMRAGHAANAADLKKGVTAIRGGAAKIADILAARRGIPRTSISPQRRNSR